MPSGLPAPTSCNATKCMNTRAININGKATTCNAKNLEIVEPDMCSLLLSKSQEIHQYTE